MRTLRIPISQPKNHVDDLRAYTAFDPASNSVFYDSDNLLSAVQFGEALRAQGRQKFHSLDQLVNFRAELIEALGFTQTGTKICDIDLIRAAENLVCKKFAHLVSRKEILLERDMVLYRDWDPTKGRPWLGNGNLFASLGALFTAVNNLHLDSLQPGLSLRLPQVPNLEGGVMPFFKDLTMAG